MSLVTVTGTALWLSPSVARWVWEKAANAAVEADRGWAMGDMIELWNGLGTLSGIGDVITGKLTTAKLRERSLLTTAGVEYSMAYAMYLAHEKGIGYGDVAPALAEVNVDRPRVASGPPPSEADPITTDESIFAGNLIDPVTGKVGSGRPAWEAAAEALFSVIAEKTARYPIVSKATAKAEKVPAAVS